MNVSHRKGANHGRYESQSETRTIADLTVNEATVSAGILTGAA